MGVVEIFALIPQIYNVVKLFKPIKDKVKEISNSTFADEKAEPITDKKTVNRLKHEIVFKWLVDKVLPKLEKYGINEDDLHVTIDFIVLFVRKLSQLSRFKRFRGKL